MRIMFAFCLLLDMIGLVISEWVGYSHPGFYAHLFTRGFSTNNYVEGLNFALKSMLVLRPNLRVDSMFSVIFEMFLPKYTKLHLDRNVDTWDGRQYKRKTFPHEFGNRPLCVLEGLLARKNKAEKIQGCKIDATQAASGIFRFPKNDATLKAEFMLYRAKTTSAAGKNNTTTGMCVIVTRQCSYFDLCMQLSVKCFQDICCCLMCLHAVCKSIGRPPSSPKEVQEKGASKEQFILDAVYKGEQAVGHEYLKVWTQSIPKHDGMHVYNMCML